MGLSQPEQRRRNGAPVSLDRNRSVILDTIAMLTLVLAEGAPPSSKSTRQINEWFDDHGRFCGRAFSSGDLRWIEWAGAGVFAFQAGSRVVRVWPEANAPSSIIHDAFFRVLQPIILQAVGMQALHAGAAAGPLGAVAFCGRSHSGKSTLAFAMRNEGWRQIADDALVWRLDEANRVLARPLPFTPRFRPPTLAHFGSARSYAESPGSRQSPETPLIAIFLLMQDSGLASPQFERARHAESFAKVLAHAHCFDENDSFLHRQMTISYLELAARVPVIALRYPPSLERLTDLTRAVVDEVADISRAHPALAAATGSLRHVQRSRQK
jgi:hypothetical protein